MSKRRFYDRLKDHQIAWAETHGLAAADREVKQGRPWVLKEEEKRRNLFEPNWWRFIEGKEHRWARALTSSQCFAVNLFAPLAENSHVARSVFQKLVADRTLSTDDEISLAFEHTPDGGPNWLGERGQPTQVDVFFTVFRGERAHGHLLVEVKLGEAEFGSCRGARKGKGNPDPSRCLNLTEVLAKPHQQCWLVESEGRRYWEHMKLSDSGFRLGSLPPGSSCPFAGGLYQVMRNQVLAQQICTNSEAKWADVALCIHSGNLDVRRLRLPVAGHEDVTEAFSATNSVPLREIDFAEIIAASSAALPSLNKWADWMTTRYIF